MSSVVSSQKTTKELLDIGTRHTSVGEDVGSAFVLGNTGTATSGGRAAPIKATVKSIRKHTKGGKKGEKRWLHRIAIMTSNDNSGEEADSSDKGFIVAAKRDFKRQTRPPKDHFKKLLEATYPRHPYPV
jgi:hypothetical protein